MTVARNVDLVVLVLALPIFLAAGLPMLGYGVGAAAWIAQRLVQAFTERKARSSEDPKVVVGVTAGSMIGRGWLVALTIFGVGLADEDAGLAAAVLCVVLFTAYFTAKMILRPFDTPVPTEGNHA